MSIPAEGFPLTAAVSPRVQIVESTGSTNEDVVAAVITDSEQWPHLALLLTHDQRAGRGRLDRTWTTPPGTALAVSVVIRVPDLPVQARGWIPLMAGAAMTRAIREQVLTTGHEADLKWPNDVLLDGAKICGILAEVVPDHPYAVVIGAGVNTRMPRSDLPLPTATSFEAAGLVCDEDRLLADYLRELDVQLTALTNAGGDAVAAELLADIEALCSTIGRDVVVSLPDGTKLEGKASAIDIEGRLVVTDDTSLAAVSAGDVVHVR